MTNKNYKKSTAFFSGRSRRSPGAGICLAVLLAASLSLSGCSGTGTMYTPDSDETADPASTGLTAAAEAPVLPPADPDEEPRVRSQVLEGTGSDLFTAETVDYYYSFTLDSTSFQLPCSMAQFTHAGWELVLPDSGSGEETDVVIPAYSYEFFDAVPAGEKEASAGSGQAQKKVRLCLANFTKEDCLPSAGTVCGISVHADSGVSLLTAFKEGTGSTLNDLAAVFGTDKSVCSVTRYADGTRILRYRFSNGLSEGQRIPVLAEAADKSLGELMEAESSEDGKTIRTLSLYYFRLPR